MRFLALFGVRIFLETFKSFNMILNTSERYQKEELIVDKVVTEPSWAPKKKEKISN